VSVAGEVGVEERGDLRRRRALGTAVLLVEPAGEMLAIQLDRRPTGRPRRRRGRRRFRRGLCREKRDDEEEHAAILARSSEQLIAVGVQPHQIAGPRSPEAISASSAGSSRDGVADDDVLHRRQIEVCARRLAHIRRRNFADTAGQES